MSLLSIYLVTHSGLDTSEASYDYTIAENIIKHGAVSFSHPMEGIYTRAPNGRTYASHEIGNALFLIPVAMVNTGIEWGFTRRLGPPRVSMITRLLFSSMGAILGATGLVLLYLILRLVFEQPLRASVASVLMFGFCTFWWSYSRILFDGLLSAVLLCGGMLSLFLFARRREPLLLVLTFVCFGAGLITRLTMVLGILAACVYLLLILPGRQLLLAAGASLMTLAPFVAWQLYYNQLRTGNPLVSPVQTAQYAVNNGLDGNLLVGIPGLLFSPGKSIFLYCPVALLSVLLFRRFWRQHRNEAVFLALLGVFWVALHAQLHSWFGAWGWGPRLLLTVTPAIAIPFLVERSTVRSVPLRALGIVALAFGFTLAAASIVINWHYRMILADDRNLLDKAWVWSLNQNQVIDALTGAAQDLHSAWSGSGAPEEQSGSNTGPHVVINLWWVTAGKKGVPRAPLAGAVMFLALAAAWCLTQLWRMEPGTGPSSPMGRSPMARGGPGIAGPAGSSSFGQEQYSPPVARRKA
jgi:hypothetical protein